METWTLDSAGRLCLLGPRMLYLRTIGNFGRPKNQDRQVQGSATIMPAPIPVRASIWKVFQVLVTRTVELLRGPWFCYTRETLTVATNGTWTSSRPLFLGLLSLKWYILAFPS